MPEFNIAEIRCSICEEYVPFEQRKYLDCGHFYCSPDPKNVDIEPNPQPSPVPESNNCYYKLIMNKKGKCFKH